MHRASPSAHPSPPSAVHFFLPRNLVKCGVFVMPKSVCLSVCTSVCHTREPRLNGSRCRNIRCTVHHTIEGRFYFLGDQIFNTEFRACGRNDCVKQRHPLATAKIGPIIRHISETCKKGRKLILFTHRMLHTCFPLVRKLVTLNDLERRINRYFALFRGIRPRPRTHVGKSWLYAHGPSYPPMCTIIR